MGQQQLLEQETSAFARVDAPCPYFGTCGGCTLQDLAYQDQVTVKRDRIRRALAGLGELPAIELLGLEDPWRYRNKAEFTFSQDADGRLTLGYHAARSFWRIVDLDDCLLLPASVGPVLQSVRDAARRTGLPVYQPRTHQGFFRYLVVRASQSGALLLCLITAPGSKAAVEAMAQELMDRHPAIVGVHWGVTSRMADIAVPEELIRLRGAEWLEEQVGPFHVRLHPLSFLQPTTVQADRLYRLLIEMLPDGEGPSGVAWDLYCGVGLIGFYLSTRMAKVYSIDVVPSHLELAQANAALNGITNIEFRTGRVEALLADRRFWLQEAKPDLVVVDPPRAGLHPDALSSLLAARPKHLAYFSCNAQSLARDLQMLLSSFPRYRLVRVTGVDMFPHTNHVEVFTFLERRA